VKLATLTTQGVRGVPDGTYRLSDGRGEPFDLVLITGGGGAGKTSFLHAILAVKEDVGAYAERPAARAVVRRGAPLARIEAEWVLSAAETSFARCAERITTTSLFGEDAPPFPEHDAGLKRLLEEYSRDAGRSKVEYFHATRQLPCNARGTATPYELAERRARLSSTDEKYLYLAPYLVHSSLSAALELSRSLQTRGVLLRGALDMGAHNTGASVGACVAPFLRGRVFDGVGVDSAGDLASPRFVDALGHVVGLDELSESERQGLLFALTFHRSRVQDSMVLIDGPELHIAPSAQLDFLSRIRALGQGNQILAATMAPALVASVPKAQVIHLDRPGETAG
jgi:hypothetical protein